MFEKVVLRRSESGNPISAGQTAEALLFYQNVHLVIDFASFGHLMQQIGPGNLLALLRRDDCTAVYCEESVGTQSQPVGSLVAHTYIAYTFAGQDEVGEFSSREVRVAYMFERHGTSNAKAKRLAKEFLTVAPPRKLSTNYYIKGGVTVAARSDLDDIAFVRDAVNTSLAATPGGLPLGSALQFDVQDSDLGMYIFHNIDFKAINQRRANLHPPLEAINVAHLLTHILDARTDLSLASYYGGDLISSEVTSSIIRLRYAEILRRAQINSEHRTSFHEVILPDYPTLRETIESGQRSFKDFLILLDKAKRFKQWLRSTSADQGLIRSYLTEVKSEGWLQSVPAKTARYLFTSALDLHSPLLGVAASVADNFIVDKLLGGWRPNHFIEKQLEPFVKR